MPIKASVPKNKSGQQNSKGNTNWEYARCAINVGEDSVRIYFLDKPINDEDANGNPISTFESERVDIKDLPNFPHMPPAKTRIAECKVRFDHQNHTVIAINPMKGNFVAKLTDIGPKSDDKTFPVFSVENDVPSSDGRGTYTRKQFWVGYDIVEDKDNNGLFVGCKVALYLHYKFYGRDDGFTDVEGTSKAFRTTQLINWLVSHHLSDVDIKWPTDGNVLPELLRRLTKGEAEATIRLKIDKGYGQDTEPLTYSTVSVIPDELGGAESRYEHPDDSSHKAMDDEDFN